MWDLSTGFKAALANTDPAFGTRVTGTTGITLGDGDGTVISGADTINDGDSGLAAFAVDEWLTFNYPGNANDAKRVKALDVAAGKIEVAAGSWASAVTSNSDSKQIMEVTGGNLKAIMQNMQLWLYGGTQPADADASEGGATVICKITLDGGTFVVGSAANGLNFGQYASDMLRRAIDPATGNVENWQGENLTDGTITWARLYANAADPTTGASTTDVRMDAAVSQTSGDIILSNRTAVSGATTEVVDVRFKIVGATYVA